MSRSNEQHDVRIHAGMHRGIHIYKEYPDGRGTVPVIWYAVVNGLDATGYSRRELKETINAILLRPTIRPEEDTDYQFIKRKVLDGTTRPQISVIHRHFRIGYGRAAMIIELLEYEQVITPMGTDGARELNA